MAFVGKALELISPEKGMEAMRPWWDVVSGIVADAMIVISFVSISLQLFGGFGSAVKCVPILAQPPERLINPSSPSWKMEDGMPWTQRMIVDAECVEKDMRAYAKYLGYILFIQVWLLLAIDNFWLKWSKSASKLKSFVELTERCKKSKCDHETIKMQLKRATGERLEGGGFKGGGPSSSQLVKIEEKEIENALNLSDKSMKMVDAEQKSKFLANIYIVKTVLKLVVSSLIFGFALYRLFENDFRFKFKCDVSHLNQHLNPDEGNDTDPRFYNIVQHHDFECFNVVGPFSKYVMILFLILTLAYMIVSFIGLAMFAYIKNPLQEILKTYKETEFEEEMETKIENLMKNQRKDIVFLLFFLYTTHKDAFNSFKEFLSPLFHDDLIRLATNRKWNSAEMERRKLAIGGDDEGFSISLADVELTSLPACLFSVVGLKELDLSFNENLVNLDGIEKLEELVDLKIEACGFTDLSFVLRLPHLERLVANENKVSVLPDGIETLQKLSCLDISQNEPLTSLPPVLNEMKTLTELHTESQLMQTLDPNHEVWIQIKNIDKVYRRVGSRLAKH